MPRERGEEKIVEERSEEQEKGTDCGRNRQRDQPPSPFKVTATFQPSSLHSETGIGLGVP